MLLVLLALAPVGATERFAQPADLPIPGISRTRPAPERETAPPAPAAPLPSANPRSSTTIPGLAASPSDGQTAATGIRVPHSTTRLLATDLVQVDTAPQHAILRANAPDPELFSENGTHYLYATGTGGADVALHVSKDLLSWHQSGNALDLSNSELWYQRGHTWAPAVEKFGDVYVMYFTARLRDTNRQCIGVATAGTPLGPFTPAGALPLVCDADGGSIDASVFTHSDGQRYLLWKNDGNAIFASGVTRIQVRPLEADGLHFSPGSQATELLHNDPVGWEAANPKYSLIEQPEMIAVAGQHFLFYSGNKYNSPQYGIGYALCDSPLGPCAKQTVDQAWLTTYDSGSNSSGSAEKVWGPGALNFATGPDGQHLAVFHGWPEPIFSAAEGGRREVYLGAVTFDDGQPVMTSFATGL